MFQFWLFVLEGLQHCQVLAQESQGDEKKSPKESSRVPREPSAGSRRSLPVLQTPLSSNFEVDLLNNSNKLMCPV